MEQARSRPSNGRARPSTGTFAAHHGAEVVSPSRPKPTPPHPLWGSASISPEASVRANLCADLQGKRGERTALRPRPSWFLARAPGGARVWPTHRPLQGGVITARFSAPAAARSRPGGREHAEFPARRLENKHEVWQSDTRFQVSASAQRLCRNYYTAKEGLCVCGCDTRVKRTGNPYSSLEEFRNGLAHWFSRLFPLCPTARACGKGTRGVTHQSTALGHRKRTGVHRG